jgi:hypothetical protein
MTVMGSNSTPIVALLTPQKHVAAELLEQGAGQHAFRMMGGSRRGYLLQRQHLERDMFFKLNFHKTKLKSNAKRETFCFSGKHAQEQ